MFFSSPSNVPKLSQHAPLLFLRWQHFYGCFSLYESNYKVLDLFSVGFLSLESTALFHKTFSLIMKTFSAHWNNFSPGDAAVTWPDSSLVIFLPFLTSGRLCNDGTTFYMGFYMHSFPLTRGHYWRDEEGRENVGFSVFLLRVFYGFLVFT